MDLLKEKVAVVSGAGRGIGKAIAKRFVEEKAKVAVLALHEESAAQAAQEIDKSGSRVLPVSLDLAVRDQVVAMFDQVEKALGPVDILVSNAATMIRQPFLELEEKNLDRLFAVNTKGALFCCQEYAKRNIARDAKTGRIIVISSMAAFTVNPFADLAGYELSKAPLNMMIKRMAYDLGPYGITVTGISPSWVKTEMFVAANEPKVSPKMPLGRVAKPEEMASIAAFLASDDSSFVTGSIIQADGGLFTHC